jgi:hypothetical protein
MEDVIHLVIENGLVTNAIVGPVGDCPEGWTCIERPAHSEAWIGWGYADGQFVAPVPPVVELTTEEKLAIAMAEIEDLKTRL